MQGARTKLKKLWPHDHNDKSTWKYLTCVIGGDSQTGLYVSRWILNPNFKYKDLDPTYYKELEAQKCDGNTRRTLRSLNQNTYKVDENRKVLF